MVLPRSAPPKSVDEGERCGNDECRRSALEHAGSDEDGRRRGESAEHRRDAEPCRAHDEHHTLTQEVTKRSADQDQRAQRQQVTIEDPLDGGSPPPRSASI